MTFKENSFYLYSEYKESPRYQVIRYITSVDPNIEDEIFLSDAFTEVIHVFQSASGNRVIYDVCIFESEVSDHMQYLSFLDQKLLLVNQDES